MEDKKCDLRLISLRNWENLTTVAITPPKIQYKAEWGQFNARGSEVKERSMNLRYQKVKEIKIFWLKERTKICNFFTRNLECRKMSALNSVQSRVGGA